MSDKLPLLVFGAHPDDIEFGVGGIVAQEARAGGGYVDEVCHGSAGAVSPCRSRRPVRRPEAWHTDAVVDARLEFGQRGRRHSVPDDAQGVDYVDSHRLDLHETASREPSRYVNRVGERFQRRLRRRRDTARGAVALLDSQFGRGLCRIT